MMIGILAIVIASTFLGIIPSIQKQVLMSGVTVNSLIFITNLVTSVITLFAILIQRHSLRINRKQLRQLVLMGVMGMGLTGFLLNSAYAVIPVGMATMLHFIYPSVVCVVMGTLFHEGFSKLQVAAIVVSIVGMILLAGPGDTLNPIGMLLAILSAFTYGFYMIANEKGAANTLPLVVKLFYVSLVGAGFFGILSAATHTLVLPAAPAIWFRLVAVSGVGSTLCFYLVTVGVRRLGAATASFLSMLEPITSMAFSTLIFHDPVSAIMVCGGIFVLISVVLITWENTQKEKSYR